MPFSYGKAGNCSRPAVCRLQEDKLHIKQHLGSGCVSLIHSEGRMKHTNTTSARCELWGKGTLGANRPESASLFTPLISSCLSKLCIYSVSGPSSVNGLFTSVCSVVMMVWQTVFPKDSSRNTPFPVISRIYRMPHPEVGSNFPSHQSGQDCGSCTSERKTWDCFCMTSECRAGKVMWFLLGRRGIHNWNLSQKSRYLKAAMLRGSPSSSVGDPPVRVTTHKPR